jgi:hypothetical protein
LPGIPLNAGDLAISQETRMAQTSDQVTSRTRLAVSGAEVILLILLIVLGMGLFVWAERAFTSIYSEPSEQQFMSESGSAKQEELLQLQRSKTDVQNQIASVELEQLRHKATLETLKVLHPGIEKAQADTAVSADAVKSYEASKTQELIAGELVKLLKDRSRSLNVETDTIVKDLEREKKVALSNFETQKNRYFWRKTAVSVLLPLLIVAIAWLVIRLLLKVVASKKIWTGQGWLPFLVVVCSMLILVTYQISGIVGAVSLGLIMFLFVVVKTYGSSKRRSRVSRQGVE